MEETVARAINADADMESILAVLDSRWKRAAVSTLLAEYLKENEIYEIGASSSGKQIEYMNQDFKFLAHSFSEQDGYFYVIEAKEVNKAVSPKSYDVRVYQFDPVDNWVEEIFLRGFRSNEPLGAQREAIDLFREFRDCDDIKEQLDKRMIVGYEANREAIIASRKSLIQSADYESVERALNRGLVKPGEPVLVYYESDESTLETRTRCVSRFGITKPEEVEEEVRDNYVLLFRMPEERFSIRSIVSGNTSGDYIDLHDVWIQRPAFEGYIVREDDNSPSKFRKQCDERFYLERGVISSGSFLVAFGQEAINQVMMDPEIKEKYGVGFRPVRYRISQALSMMPGE